MKGHRVPDGTARHESKPGDYGRSNLDGKMVWWCHPPGSVEQRQRAGFLLEHQVTEHEDGAITVSPSILIHPFHDDPGWHGYLDHGEWREV